MKRFLYHFIFIILISVYLSKTPYDDLLSWGKNNSLFISDKLGMRYINENNKSYYALDDIPENTLIMNIPYELMLNSAGALKLLENKKLEKIYEEYKKLQFGIEVGFLPASLEQSFLAFLFRWYLLKKNLNSSGGTFFILELIFFIKLFEPFDDFGTDDLLLFELDIYF